jgi:hypothetical protein
MKNDSVIRLVAFLGVFAILTTAELFAPRRRLTTSKSRRWFANLTIVALNPLSVALVYPVLPVGLALLASEQSWGLLNRLALPYWLEVLIGVVVLAPGTPLGHHPRDQQQLRVQPALVGPAAGHLQGSARQGAYGYGDRPIAIPRSTKAFPAAPFGPSVRG